jgi:hypothetical protein
MGVVVARLSLEGLRQAEVEHSDLALAVHFDVGRLEVAVDDSLGVSGLQRLCDATRDCQRFLERHCTPGDPLSQGLAVHQLHHQETSAVVLLQAVDSGNVGVVEGGEEAGFALEPGEALGVRNERLWQELDRDCPAKVAVVGSVDLAHAALAELARDGVVRQGLTDHDAPRGSTLAPSGVSFCCDCETQS